ncbi:cell wall hydrolase [Clostridium transplantifaecale]|uniref:cell wall hydrolase n=1 Tax=Clostridium transplantifaecale TaxID=2479838 RepID=UPI000F63666E|nr:cell wall hydrolase [Clostridium transplantifaecale]
MIKKILCILPVITLLYMAPGALFAAEGDAAGQEQAAVVTEAYGPASEALTDETQTAVNADATAQAGTEQGEQPAAQPAQETQTEGTDEALTQPVASYTEEDLYVMAHVLAGECQSCPDQEQLYVGSVVLNRRNHPSFPNSVKGVVFQKGQYSCTRDGNYYREPTDRNWANAKSLLENGSVLPANVIWQSGGRQGKGVYVKTKWHYYCY